MSRKQKTNIKFLTFNSKLLFRTAIVMLGMVLMLGLYLSMSSINKANAMDSTQWEKVRGYVNEYFGGPQYNAGEAGELGFRITKVDLVGRLDSNNNISPKYASLPTSGTVPGPEATVTGVLGEGDDAANRPVLIDNLMTRTDVIPGTEFRCNWNVDGSCFADTSLSAIRTIVDNHKAAGFSTDIVDYCVSAQTAGPTTGGFGIIAQVPGALSSDTSLTPNVYTLKYARNGWRNFATPLSGANGVTAPEAATGVPNATPSTVANCDASANDYTLVSCQANWAIAATLGNVGNGSTTTAPIAAVLQTVDIRPGTINTVATTGVNMQVPISTLFSTGGLANLDPTKSTSLISHTQHGADAAIGLKMLGYNLVAASGSINGGIVRWDSTQGEQQVVLGDNLPTQTILAFAAPGPVDTTGPSVTSVGSSAVTTSSANIDRVAGEPATMKVEYGTTSGGPYTSTVNNTVLNANKTVSLSGLNDGTTYYYRATSYDGQANGTVSAEGSFRTVASPATDWTKVKGYIAAYISNQYIAGDEGEAGFVASAASLNGRINSLNDTAILGEGDDAANAPVLVDNLGANTDYIPGTSIRCVWNSGAGLTGNTENCFDQAVINAVKARADAHAAAGFSTDIIDYCQSGHTQAASTGAFGYIAQTGALRSDSSIPKVYGLKWGRNGWTNSIAAYDAVNPIAAASAVSPYTPPTSNPGAACNSTVSDAELVRCQAQQSSYNSVVAGGTVNGMTGGNVGNGQRATGTSPAQTLATGGIVDIRTGSPGSTVSGTPGGTVQIPLDTLFTSGLVNVNPAATNGILIGSRTPMVGGIAAEGLKMLGYGMSTGGFIHGGVPEWNNTLNEKQVTDSLTRAALIPTATAIDTIAPTINSGPTVSNITTTSADISRVTNEPATSKITLTGSDGHVVNFNNTVLNATKTVTVTGLHGGVTYSGTLTAYDGQANASSPATIASFTTSTVVDYPVIGAIKIKWDSLSGAPGPALGAEYAVMNGSTWLGQAQDFSNGRIFWNPSGGCYWIHGGILVKYNELGGATGFLGIPVSDEYDIADGRGANFAGGRIYWSLNTGAHAVHGGVLTKLLSDGGVARDGFPTSDEYDVPGHPGARAGDFQRAQIYWTAGDGAHTVFGGIFVTYMAYGGPTSLLGLPLTDEYPLALPGGAARSRFQHGFITWWAPYGTWIDVM